MEGIVVPTGTAADLTLMVNLDGKTYSADVSGASVTQGKCSQYTLTVNAGGVGVVWC